MKIQKKGRRVMAAEDFEVENYNEDTEFVEDAVVDVADEAADLLFESEDVAELIAEVTGDDVEVTGDEESVVFTVGEDEYVVEPDGTEDIVESRRVRRPNKVSAAKRALARRRLEASRNAKRPARRRVAASSRTVRPARASRAARPAMGACKGRKVASARRAVRRPASR